MHTVGQGDRIGYRCQRSDGVAHRRLERSIDHHVSIVDHLMSSTTCLIFSRFQV